MSVYNERRPTEDELWTLWKVACRVNPKNPLRGARSYGRVLKALKDILQRDNDGSIEFTAFNEGCNALKAATGKDTSTAGPRPSMER